MEFSIPMWMYVTGKYLLIGAGCLGLLFLAGSTWMLFHILTALFPGDRRR